MSLLSILVFGSAAATTGSNHLPPLLAGFSAGGIAAIGTQSALYGLAASAYPTTFRATGIGVAGSVGRAGALASSYFGGAVLSIDSGPSIFLALVVILFLLMPN